VARRPQPADLGELLERIGRGSVRAACEAMGLDLWQTLTWLQDDERRQHYASAREIRAEDLSEQALAIGLACVGRDKADGPRVALDAIKWRAGQMSPKHNPAQRLELGGPNGGPAAVWVVPRFNGDGHVSGYLPAAPGSPQAGDVGAPGVDAPDLSETGVAGAPDGLQAVPAGLAPKGRQG
jgi:hypothetical protein